VYADWLPATIHLAFMPAWQPLEGGFRRTVTKGPVSCHPRGPQRVSRRLTEREEWSTSARSLQYAPLPENEKGAPVSSTDALVHTPFLLWSTTLDSRYARSGTPRVSARPRARRMRVAAASSSRWMGLSSSSVSLRCPADPGGAEYLWAASRAVTSEAAPCIAEQRRAAQASAA